MKNLLSFLLLFSVGIFSACSSSSGDFNFSQAECKLTLEHPSIEKDFKVMLIADSHFSTLDGLDDKHKDFASRMNKHGDKDFTKLKKAIARAEAENYSAVILAGDIINFPSQSNVSAVLDCIKGAKIPVLYTSGNHDWHFEGDAGSDLQQRERWVNKVLSPLYPSKNWKLYSKNIAGIKFIAVDNSAYEILPEQLADLRKELSDGMPVVIFAHIPFYLPSFDNIFVCGDPKWGAAVDPYFEIERRQKWSATGHSQTTFDFWKEVFNSPNVLGILAGHTHKLTTHFYNGKFQVVAPSFKRGGQFLDISFRTKK